MTPVEPNSSEHAKRRAAVAGARLAEPGQVVGLGTGSTAAHAITALGWRTREEGLAIVGVPTSYAAAALARAEGIPIRALDDIGPIDLAIDGTDEVDPRKNLLKGGGGAQTWEKIVASSADRFVVIADETKLVDRLGTTRGVPLEVLPGTMSLVARRIRELGGAPDLRLALGGHGQPFITQLGNLIVDANFGPIEDPALLAATLSAIPGVVEHGLFFGMAHIVLIGELANKTVRRLE